MDKERKISKIIARKKGKVVSDKMQKTIIVAVTVLRRIRNIKKVQIN